MEFTVSTDTRLDVVDVTDRVAAAVPAGTDGTVTVFVEHTTAGVTINEAEPRLLSDVRTVLADLVPDDGWAHDELDGNADSHLRALLLGPSETVPVAGGDLALGRWQSVLFVECDGPRERTVRVLDE
ncbi:secondary thiamine-phosphate synthase enzyme YjbQ [Haloplanus pelagicus]|uniref:secondary thiamine-phosphate synthase enzyme YjbQ n=1 Tax=Haloplanus pelagicus TaxID=2949995 RepID=UPI0020422362|nr:secondary thiamine-phosphate synthase enzyme YjbQ [Haloplanus sp. HW8-1]